MSASDQMRQMLDELMGTGRDGADNKYKVNFDDPRVCKSFLLACCPHDILSSTRMDLGECPKLHDLALRADFDHGQKKRDYYYDIDALEHLNTFIQECDRKVDLAKRRLKETQEELSEEANDKAEAIHALGEQMGTKLAKAEAAGADGNVDMAQSLMAEVEELKRLKSHAEMEFRNSMPASSYQQQKLRVCEVCSAYLGIHDNDRRLADHFGGKLHLGFISIREKLADLQKSVPERRFKREQERDELRQNREKERVERESRPERERSSRSSRDRDRSERSDRSEKKRSRSKDRKHRSRSKDRSRSRSRSRHSRKHSRRSRSRDRRSRSRSRSKKHSRRSRSREHRSSRSKRSRSRSHGHHRSSRSKSKEKQDRHKSRSHSKEHDESRSKESDESRRTEDTDHSAKHIEENSDTLPNNVAEGEAVSNGAC